MTNVAITPGAGATIATDTVGGVEYQRVRFGCKATVVTATPTLDTSAYAVGDCLHTTVIEFANAVGASLSGIVEKMVVFDKIAQSQPLVLHLYSATVTPAAANAAHSLSDADGVKYVGSVYSGIYESQTLNSVAMTKNVGLAIKLAGTSLFGILVTKGTPTYAADSLTVSLLIQED